MIYRLKAPTRKDIEEQISFALYSEDEEGNEQPVFATADYSYHFIGKEWITEPEYDEDGNVITEGELSDYVLADLADWRDKPEKIDFGSEVEILEGIKTPMHGWT